MSQRWMDKDRRLEQLDEWVKQTKQAHFGSEEMGEADKALRVRRHFDAVARRYDFMNTVLSFGAHYMWKRRAVRLLGLKAGDRVLDVGCGAGILSEALVVARRSASIPKPFRTSTREMLANP